MKFLKNHIVELVVSLIFIILSVVLNLQFLTGSNINTTIAGHDEYIAVKEVYSILAPESPKHFVMAIISGDALYYGRIMFYMDALFAYVPFLIWGIKGMVFSIRMTHALAMLFAFLILSQTFLKNNLQKLIFFIGSIGLYYSLYFIMMPKPEPHQLLFLALFLKYFKKNNWSFGWYFLLLGIAYGLKFNILIILPFVFGLPIYNHIKTKSNGGLKKFFVSCLYFIAGIVIAVPCLILSPIKPAFLKAYIHATFGGTSKSYDDASINVFDWMNAGLGGSYLGISFLSYIFLAIVGVVLIAELRRSLKSNQYTATLLLLCGAVMTVVIMFKTKRLWPHYLWTSYLLMILGLNISAFHSNKNQYKNVLKGVLVLFTACSFFFFFYRELPLYLDLENKTTSNEFYKNDVNAINFIKSYYKNQKVGTDGSIFYPFEDFLAVNIYHPFKGNSNNRTNTPFNWYTDYPEKIWEENDVVVFRKWFPPKLIKDQANFHVSKHEMLNQLYIQQTNSNFSLDTSFGEVKIFKRRAINPRKN